MMGKNVVLLAPSILSADFVRLGEQVREAEQAGANRIHVDVMDGHFVPNLSMGASVVDSLRRVTRLPLETHLMISAPDSFLDEFTEAGSDSFLVHWEGNYNLSRTVQRISRQGTQFLYSIRKDIPCQRFTHLSIPNRIYFLTSKPRRLSKSRCGNRRCL